MSSAGCAWEPGHPSKCSDEDYDFKSFHWHAPSQHKRQGQQFAMEQHLAHETESEPKTTLVVGAFVQLGDHNAEMGKSFANLPNRTQTARTVTGFNLSALLPRNRQSYRYMGSKTTRRTRPACVG